MYILEAIRDGFLVGMALTFLIGPVFFLLLSTSIDKGFKPGAHIAIGVMLSDALYILVAYFGSALMVGKEQYNYIFGIIGGAILIVFGIVNFFKKPSVNKNDDVSNISKKDLFHFMLKGFAMNSFNPFVLIFWLGVASSISIKNYNNLSTLLFYLAVLVTVLSTDLLKVYLANKLQKIITVPFLIWMNRISGTALVVFGIRILIKSFSL